MQANLLKAGGRGWGWGLVRGVDTAEMRYVGSVA